MAKKVKPQAKPNMQTQQHEQAAEFLADVPEEYIFWSHDGRSFRSMKDLAEGLVTMSDDTFVYHLNSERNDFAKWVKEVIKDDKLANNLGMAINKEQAIEYVAGRLTILTSKVA